MSGLRKRNSAANVAKATKPETTLTATIADPTKGHLGVTLTNAEQSIGVLVEHVECVAESRSPDLFLWA